MKLFTRRSLRRLAILFLLIALSLLVCWRVMLWSPGRSHRGPLPALTESQAALAAELEHDVRTLAADIGSRSIFFPRKLAEAAVHLRDQLELAGYTTIAEYPVERGSVTPTFEATLRGSTHPDQIIVIGAHYDVFQGTPGADDNASGCAAVLALARRFSSLHSREPSASSSSRTKSPPTSCSPPWAHGSTPRPAAHALQFPMTSAPCSPSKPSAITTKPPTRSTTRRR